MTIILDDIPFTVVHRTNKRIKKVTIALENQNEVIVKTPLKFKAHQIQEVVRFHKDWILRTTKKIKPKNYFDFVHGDSIVFLGEKYPFELIEDEKIKLVKVVFDEKKFYFYHNPLVYKYEDFYEGLKKFYKKVAKKYIDPIFDLWCFKTKLYPNEIKYRFARKQWGSCSYKNNISINYMLLQFPISAIEYVVLHELCHIKEKNHSKRFYNLLALYMENYKIEENILKEKVF